MDMIICGAGTGGTVAGIGRKIKEEIPSCQVGIHVCMCICIHWSWNISILVGSGLGSRVPNHHCKHVGRLNMAVHYGITVSIHVHVCVCVKKKVWQTLIWHLRRKTSELPNLIPCQVFWLYCTIILCCTCILNFAKISTCFVSPK